MLTAHSVKRFPGLIGAVNPNTPPEGAAEVDQDVVHRSINVTEPRRGFSASTVNVGGPLNAIAFKQGKLIAATYASDNSGNGNLRLYDPATDAWSNLIMRPGNLTLDRPGLPGAHTRFVSSNKAVYFHCAYGLTKIEDVSAVNNVSRVAIQPKIPAGISAIPAGVSISVPTLSPANNWFPTNTEVAYRVTVARRGANHELIESEPSDRVVSANQTGSTCTQSVVIYYPWLLSPDSFFRVYRCKSAAIGSSTDEMFLIAELFPTGSADSNAFVLSNSNVPYTDITPDSSLYIPLYTNPQSGNGIQNSDTPAPLSFDMAWFKNRLHFLNTSDVQRLTVKVIGTGTGGLQDGDSITVNGIQFKFQTSGVSFASPYRQVTLYTGGTVAANLENTARALVASINAYFQRVYYAGGGKTWGGIMATYISLTGVDAGQIVLQSIVPGAAAFTVSTSTSAGWDRDYTAGTTSDPNAQVSGWMWSLFGQPEAVPTANNNNIGDPTAAGQRFIALKEALFAFKQDGLWKITDDGSTVGPQVTLVDPTVRLIAPETAVAVDNMIFALCDQGVVLITETGAVENISHVGIERDLFKLMAYVGSTNLAERAFGVAYLPEHTYILCLPESPNANTCTKQYVYNLQSRAWSSWNIPGGVISGAVNPDTGQLYFGRRDGTLCIERKDFTSNDYQDPGFTIASPATTITKTLTCSGDLTTGTNIIAVGDLIQQFQATNALQQRVLAVSYSSSLNQTTVTLDALPRYAWSNAVNLTVVKAIQSSVKFLPFTVQEPLTDKDWGDCYLSFRYCDLDFLNIGFTSEKVPITNTAAERINNADGTANAPITLGLFGAAAWGAAIWGRQAKDVTIKCTVPSDFGYSGQMTLSLGMPCALSHFELSAIDIKIAGGTDKIVR